MLIEKKISIHNLIYRVLNVPGKLLVRQRFALYTSGWMHWQHCRLCYCSGALMGGRTRRRCEVFVLFCCRALTLDRLVLAAPTKQRILAVDRRRTPYCRAPLYTYILSGESVSTFFSISCVAIMKFIVRTVSCFSIVRAKCAVIVWTDSCDGLWPMEGNRFDLGKHLGVSFIRRAQNGRPAISFRYAISSRYCFLVLSMTFLLNIDVGIPLYVLFFRRIAENLIVNTFLSNINLSRLLLLFLLLLNFCFQNITSNL